MSDALKHECAVAMVRLRKDLSYYKSKYGIENYGLSRLILLLEKQHNRGQDGAGIAALHLHPEPGRPAYQLVRSAADNPLADVLQQVGDGAEFHSELLLGHLRYATFGRYDVSCCYPFVHESTQLGRMLLLAGNFNLTTNTEMYKRFLESGHHPASHADGYLLLQTIAHYLDREESRTPGMVNLSGVLRAALQPLDGAFTLCGMTGSGDVFAIRDAHGIRPGYYYFDDEVFVVASERPAIQAAFNCTTREVMELPPGKAVVMKKDGQLEVGDCLPEAEPRGCVFERIYFSRPNDADIHRERRNLGRHLMPQLLQAVRNDLAHTFFSYIPNSARVGFFGLQEELMRLAAERGTCMRSGQIAVKDAKLRTFIADAASRRDLYRHVYDLTYGLVQPGEDTLVVLDDSIVRGNTMRDAILPMLDRLDPVKIIVASTAPPIKYPDCYGIDMSTAGELIAFRAAVSILRKRNDTRTLIHAYDCAREQLKQKQSRTNCLAMVYAAIPDEELIAEIAHLLTPEDMRAEVQVVFQSCAALRECCPHHSGDWYFTGRYPTPGGYRVANRALVNFVENKNERTY